MIGTDPYLFETLWRQYRACRRHKRNTVNALRFELNGEENLLALQQELRDHTYRPGRLMTFLRQATANSQFWGNVYLNELDQFVKRQLGVRWYLRYVDDLGVAGAGRGHVGAIRRRG